MAGLSLVVLKVSQMLLLSAGLSPSVCMNTWTRFTRAEPSWFKPQQNRQFVPSVPVTSLQMFRVALAVVGTIVVRERQPPPPV